VLTWAYLAYVQFLIIWAADLPREISWYLRRDTPGWRAVAWTLFAVHFAAPLLILLSRKAKEAPRLMGALAALLLAVHLLDCWWLVLPSVGGLGAAWPGLAALPVFAAVLLGWLAWPQKTKAHGREKAHA
jgi:hypothetical protein